MNQISSSTQQGLFEKEVQHEKVLIIGAGPAGVVGSLVRCQG